MPGAHLTSIAPAYLAFTLPNQRDNMLIEWHYEAAMRQHPADPIRLQPLFLLTDSASTMCSP